MPGLVTVVENVTLDGVMQAPARPDEDRRDGFTHGGWGNGYADQVFAAEMGKGMAGPGALLLGRRTYEDLYQVWPNRPANPYTETLNRRLKYVASRTLKEPLPWVNSKLIEGDAAGFVAEHKRTGGEPLGVLGSGELVRSLMERNLVDEYLLCIFPLVLGSGRRLFPDGYQARLELTGSVTTTTGVVIATYRPRPA